MKNFPLEEEAGEADHVLPEREKERRNSDVSHTDTRRIELRTQRDNLTYACPSPLKSRRYFVEIFWVYRRILEITFSCYQYPARLTQT